MSAFEIGRVAVSTPFNNSTNGFSASDVQAAIEEAKASSNALGGYTFAESTAETSTTSNSTFSTKVTLTTPSLTSGNYIIFFTYIARRSAANTEYDIRVRDGTTDLVTVTETYTRTQGQNLRSSFVQLSSISGVKTFTLEFKINSGGSGTVFIRAARMAIWRVS